MNKIVVIGGGTFNPISCHLALAAPAFGATARDMVRMLLDIAPGWERVLALTKMADHTSKIVTNHDVAVYVHGLLDDPLVKVIVLNAAICDFQITNPSDEARLSSKRTYVVDMVGIQRKILAIIKEKRPDIVVVGFKTTHGATKEAQETKAIDSMRANRLDLVFANDVSTKRNVLITDRLTRYTDDRMPLLRRMLRIAVAKSCG